MNFIQEIKTTLKVIGLLLFTVATSFNSYSQEVDDDEELDLLIDDLFFNDTEFVDEILESLTTYNYIYTTVSYNSNTFFSGRDSGIDQFNIIPQISYYHSSGFNMSVSGIYYSEFDPNWDFTNVSLGYSNYIDKKKTFLYNLGYSKYFFSDASDTFTNFIDAGLGYKNEKRTFGTKVSASYLFGTDQSFQFVSSTYGSFTLSKGNAYLIKLKPRLNILLAQQTITLERFVGVLGTLPQLETFNFDVFDLLNVQFSIPLSISTSSWDFELGYHINLPNAVATETDLNTTSYLSLSVGYLFGL
jgi:hypothetical protein